MNATRYAMTTQAQIRAAFWDAFPQFTRKGRQTQNQYPTDIRVAFVDFVDSLNKNGQISESLAQRVTL